MSPVPFISDPTAAASAALARLWIELGQQIREARRARRLTTRDLAFRSGVSRTSVYTLERGEAVSLEAAVRVATALGLRLAVDLHDPRRRELRAGPHRDVVHSAMGEFEASRFRAVRLPTRLDEPYQHYQFAGRADLVSWDVSARSILHIENRTRFPDLQESAGSFNAKRAYLAAALAERLGVRGWASETHVMVGLWSAEVLHVLRLRTESFRSLCPDSAGAFESWWTGRPTPSGRTSTFVLLDPLVSGRQRTYVDLETALTVRPRYRGYGEAATALAAAGR
jgi:transcriptional regulator with XRE-family HTH domain